MKLSRVYNLEYCHASAGWHLEKWHRIWMAACTGMTNFIRKPIHATLPREGEACGQSNHIFKLFFTNAAAAAV